MIPKAGAPSPVRKVTAGFLLCAKGVQFQSRSKPPQSLAFREKAKD